MRSLLLLLLLLLLPGTLVAGPPGIQGQPAPPLDVDSWVFQPAGTDATDTAGDVVYLFFFQSWCPGCHSHGFPALAEQQARYGDRVRFIAVQTVFEGFDSNGPKQGLKAIARHQLEIPLGQSGSDGEPSRLMRSYRSAGTPWTVIIDRAGVVRFNGFRASPSETSPLLDRLLAAEAKPATGG